MRFQHGRTREEVLAELRAAAERRWGPERLQSLEPALETAANALSRVGNEPLDLLDAEPDFIARVDRQAET
jgi:hypothetical protein